MKKKVLNLAVFAALSVVPAIGQDAGFGQNIPLNLAIKRIVPENIAYDLGSGVDGNTRVTWSSENGWQKALEQAISGTGYTYTLNNNKVTVTAPSKPAPAVALPELLPAAKTEATTAPAAETKPAATAQTRANPTPPKAATPPSRPAAPAKPATPPKPAVVNVPVVPGAGFVFIPENGSSVGAGGTAQGEWVPHNEGTPVSVAPEWVVTSGMDLHSVLQEWSDKAGWKLVWESEYSYELGASAKFSGDFVTAATELLRSMQHVRPVPTADFYQGNKTLVIANNNLGEVN